MACAPGTVVRALFESEVNTIEGTIKIFKRHSGRATAAANHINVSEGVARSTADDIDGVDRLLSNDNTLDAAIGAMSVGVQTNTTVTCTRKDGEPTWYKAISGNTVTQVYVGAALDRGGTSDDKWTRFAFILLLAAYEAPLRVALVEGKVTVVLTCIVGFPPALVAAAMLVSIAIFDNTGLKIIVNDAKGELEEHVTRIANQSRKQP
jgi:hypothetical protein